MVNNTKSFQIREIDSDKWNLFVRNLKRKAFNKSKNLNEGYSIEEYLRIIIYKLGKMKMEDMNNIVEDDYKIVVEKLK